MFVAIGFFLKDTTLSEEWKPLHMSEHSSGIRLTNTISLLLRKRECQ